MKKNSKKQREARYSYTEVANFIGCTQPAVRKAVDALGLDSDLVFENTRYHYRGHPTRKYVKRSDIPKIRDWLLSNTKFKITK